jgi:hypothetical protein
MARKRSAAEDQEIPGQTCCRLCRGERTARTYEFWSGQRENYREDQMFRKKRISYTYSDLQPIRVVVCDACAAGLRRRHFLVKFIAWAVVAWPCLIVLAVIPFLGMDRLSGYLCLGLFALPAVGAGACFLYYAWQLLRPVPENEVTDRLVLTRLRQEKDFGKKGYDLFTSSEYAVMFDR